MDDGMQLHKFKTDFKNSHSTLGVHMRQMAWFKDDFCHYLAWHSYVLHHWCVCNVVHYLYSSHYIYTHCIACMHHLYFNFVPLVYVEDNDCMHHTTCMRFMSRLIHFLLHWYVWNSPTLCITCISLFPRWYVCNTLHLSADIVLHTYQMLPACTFWLGTFTLYLIFVYATHCLYEPPIIHCSPL